MILSSHTNGAISILQKIASDSKLKWTIKRILIAFGRDNLWQEFEEKFQSFKFQDISRLQKKITVRMIKVVDSIAANDDHYWRGVSDDVVQILNKYEISPNEIRIPLHQMNSLSWLYPLMVAEGWTLSRDEILESIHAIPEILKISL
jgi:hypothetical protein